MEFPKPDTKVSITKSIEKDAEQEIERVSIN